MDCVFVFVWQIVYILCMYLGENYCVCVFVKRFMRNTFQEWYFYLCDAGFVVLVKGCLVGSVWVS